MLHIDKLLFLVFIPDLLVHFLMPDPFFTACRLSLHWKLFSQNSANQIFLLLFSNVRLIKYRSKPGHEEQNIMFILLYLIWMLHYRMFSNFLLMPFMCNLLVSKYFFHTQIIISHNNNRKDCFQYGFTWGWKNYGQILTYLI